MKYHIHDDIYSNVDCFFTYNIASDHSEAIDKGYYVDVIEPSQPFVSFSIRDRACPFPLTMERNETKRQQRRAKWLTRRKNKPSPKK